MFFKNWELCRACNTVLFENEKVCPICSSADIQLGVSDEEYLKFLVGIDELPSSATVDDLIPYCISVVNGS